MFTTTTLVFPLYVIMVSIYALFVAFTAAVKWSRVKLKEEPPPKDPENRFENLVRFLENSPSLRFIVHMDDRPSLSFHVAQSIIFGLLALSTQRMVVFWSPYLCIFAAVCVANVDIWNGRCSGTTATKMWRALVIVAAILVVFQVNKGELYEELDELREFYDPDTVDLMDFINAKTSEDAAFTGSMQLLAGVRLSTFRPITNHPHFEDKALRDRTREVQ